MTRKIATLLTMIACVALSATAQAGNLKQPAQPGYFWSSTYTVRVNVDPNTSVGALAWVTLYGQNGYYGRQLTPNNPYGIDHIATFSNVPKGVARIDVDLLDGTHREFYNQNIYSFWTGTVNFTYIFPSNSLQAAASDGLATRQQEARVGDTPIPAASTTPPNTTINTTWGRIKAAYR